MNASLIPITRDKISAALTNVLSSIAELLGSSTFPEPVASAHALLTTALDAAARNDTARAVAFAGASRAASWDVLHAGDWRAAPTSARTCFACATALEVALLLSTAREEHTLTALRCALDIALLLCPSGSDGATPSPHVLLHKLLSAAQTPRPIAAAPLPSLPRSVSDAIARRAEASPLARAVPRLESPSLRDFALAAAQGPVVVTGAIEHWPALALPDRRWDSLDYLASKLRGRVAPVECGAHYMAALWNESLLPLDAFVADVVAPSVRSILHGASSIEPPDVHATTRYLAQAALFDHVPSLRDDICTPDLVAAFPTADSSAVRTLAWLGPAGTFTPLHFDAPGNLLAQVVGVKRVRLHAPGVYALAIAPAPLGNTSQLPPAALEAALPIAPAILAAARASLEALPAGAPPPDSLWPASFPEYASGAVVAHEAVLRPGDMLFIPPRWWHAVRSLTPSFSVSFWFDI